MPTRSTEVFYVAEIIAIAIVIAIVISMHHSSTTRWHIMMDSRSLPGA